MNQRTCTLFFTQAELGAATWISYWLAEYLNVQVLSILSKAHIFHTVWDAAFVGFLFVLYGFLGISIGFAIGLIIHVIHRAGCWPSKIDPFTFGFVLSAGSVLLSVSGFLYHRINLDTVQILTLTSFGLILLSVLFYPERFIAPKKLFDTGGFLIVGIWLTTVIVSAFFPPVRDSTADIVIFGIEWLTFSFLLARLLYYRSRNSAFELLRLLSTLSIAILFLVGITTIELLRIPSTDFNLARTGTENKPPNGPNILMIVLDTVRADHLSLYGYSRDTTPNLKILAEESTIYDFAISPGDMTLSSHGSIFTSLYARETGAHYDSTGVGRPLQPEFTTIAEILRSAGYRTAGIVSNMVFFGKDFGLEQGFDYFDVRPSEEYTIYKSLGHVDPLYLRKTIHDFLVRDTPTSILDSEFRRADQITEDALGFIDSHSESSPPFFLFLNYMDSHWRYMPPHPYDSLYPGKIENFTRQTYYKLVNEVTKTQARDIAPNERKHLESQYDGSINYSDAHIGKIIDRLKEKKLFEDMLIIVTSDHGEAFGSRHLIQHAVSAYQNQLWVPLVIHYPQGTPKGSTSRWISTIDIMPTILATVGIEIPNEIRGIDLLTNHEPKDRVLIGESYYNHRFLGPRFDRVERALFKYPYKLIRSTTGKHELYDLVNDPRETHNLYQQQQTIAGELNDQLTLWLSATPDYNHNQVDDQPDEQTLERLRALGYID